MFCLVCVVCHLICRAKHHGWQDTYVFTKAMGEMVINSMRGEIPVVIIRPRVIESTLRDPFPGWIQGNRSVTYYYMLDICLCIVTGSRIFALRTTLTGIHGACGSDEHITSREQTFHPRLKWDLVPAFFTPGTRETFSPG